MTEHSRSHNLSSNANGQEPPPINSGLEGVVVASTAISDVQGQRGDLSYRGRSIRHWVDREFTEVAAAILDLPAAEFDLSSLMFRWGELSAAEMARVVALKDLHPMAVLQSEVPLTPQDGARALARELNWTTPAQLDVLQGIAIAARLPHLIAVMIRGEALAYPQETDYSTRFLTLLGHTEPTPLQRRAFNVTQILQLEHSLNAGTFTARVAASTGAGVTAATAAAIGALSGVLHGGADQAAIEMADQVGSASAAADFVERSLAEGSKVMGMGHREYKVVDPRAHHVKALAKELSQGTKHADTFATLEAIELAFAQAMARKNKALHANLEFYKGIVYRALGVPDRAFTALFAQARIFGYIAHIAESRHNARIIRPAARYVGK